MQIFKFGGASLNTSKAVKNMAEIVCKESNRPLVVIVSAMGKTTNALENILQMKMQENAYEKEVKILEKYHLKICDELFPGSTHRVFDQVRTLFEEFQKTLEEINKNSGSAETYDSIVAYGELISSQIVSEYLASRTNCILLDARKIIKTDNTFKEAKVCWEETEKNIREPVDSTTVDTVIVSQGFIASTEQGKTTTLGREGSDFSAAIFASALNAESVTFWKDVPGIMNADPKIIEDSILIDHLPYQEAAEMTYYGAKVIHPKTIRPLANKGIPLFVKGFDNPGLPGTSIQKYESWEHIPVIIYKQDQCLISCKFTDFRFVNEESLVKIFDVLHDLDIKVNMMQNSAISFSICVDFVATKTDQLIQKLSKQFNLHYNKELTLITIKNYTSQTLKKYRPKKNILMEQQTRANYQAVIRK